MAEYMDEDITCKDCYHKDACASWLKHGKINYDDFSYSTEFCPHYKSAADVVEVKHGWWVNDTFCSNCNGFAEDDEGHIIMSFTDYCPHCGAKMDGGKDHE